MSNQDSTVSRHFGGCCPGYSTVSTTSCCDVRHRKQVTSARRESLGVQSDRNVDTFCRVCTEIRGCMAVPQPRRFTRSIQLGLCFSHTIGTRNGGRKCLALPLRTPGKILELPANSEFYSIFCLLSGQFAGLPKKKDVKFGPFITIREL